MLQKASLMSFLMMTAPLPAQRMRANTLANVAYLRLTASLEIKLFTDRPQGYKK